MSRVRVEVVGRPFALLHRGPVYNVGERFALDTGSIGYGDIIRRGWVRLVPSAPDVSAASLEQPPKHKMMSRRKSRRKGTKA